MSKQPEALILATQLFHASNLCNDHYSLDRSAACELERQHALIAELVDTIDSIYIYANDTLSGRTDGPDDREWQREGVAEIRNRARKFATVESAVVARALAKAKEAQ